MPAFPDGGRILMNHRQGIGILRRVVALALADALGFAPKAEACTSFLLKAADGSPVYDRTMEFGFKLQSDAIVIPEDTP
jgi:penicillin V acylase-like amidase (Ntn superfamily)